MDHQPLCHPVPRLEFLLGKRIPYIAIRPINRFILRAMAIFPFVIPDKGSFAALCLAAALFVSASTGVSLLISAFAKTQIAAILGKIIATTSMRLFGLLFTLVVLPMNCYRASTRPLRANRKSFRR